jgi:lipopolysaccharide transport system ATP-binding protein
MFYDTCSAGAGVPLPRGGGLVRLALGIERLYLNGGVYYVDVGAYERDWSYAYDYHWHVYPLTVVPAGQDKGILRAPHRWELDRRAERVSLRSAARSANPPLP